MIQDPEILRDQLHEGSQQNNHRHDNSAQKSKDPMQITGGNSDLGHIVWIVDHKTTVTMLVGRRT